MKPTKVQKTLADKIRPILKRHDVTKAEIVGSFARGEQSPESDFDIVVELPQGKTLFDLATLKQDLTDKIGREVDVTTYRSVSEHLRPHLFADTITVL